MAKPIKCGKCGTTDVGMIASQELSVSGDFVSGDHPESPMRRLMENVSAPAPMPLSGPDLTNIGHLVKGMEHLSSSLRAAFIDKGMVREGKWDSEWTEAAKKLEHDTRELRRKLEDFARATGAQLYMLE